MTKTFFSKRSDMFHYAASADYDGECIRSANAHVVDGEIYSYSTKVAMFDKEREIILLTNHFYSNTTSNTMSEIRRAFDHFKRLYVYDFDIDSAWDRLKGEVKIHSKDPATRRPDKEYFINTLYSFDNLVEWSGKNNKHKKSAVYDTAFNIADKYSKEIAEKERRAQERRAIRREKEEQERQERIKRTLDIIKEYDHSFDEEPKTFKECMEKKEFKVPVEWMEEHHPEVLTNGEYCDRNLVVFARHYDYSTCSYDKYFVFKQDGYSNKLMRQISRWGGNYSSAPDILVYKPEKKLLYTSQRCEVDDTAGHVKALLGLFLKAVDERKDTSFVIGKHCGPFEIREWNASEMFLRVGCHCFLLENLREVYEDMKGE